WRGVNPDPAPWHGRKTGASSQLLPAFAAVGALEDPATIATALHDPGLALHLPEPRIEHVGIGGIDVEVRDPGRVVPEQDLLPRPTPVGGLEDPALVVGSKGVT